MKAADLSNGRKPDLAGAIEDTLRRNLDRHLPDHTGNPLIDVAGYVLGSRGKMLRGLTLLEACRAVGGDSEAILQAAAGTEYGHLASLIHDDLMDRDELRRGRPSVWRRYGTDLALLGGDLFIFHAYHSLALCRHVVPAERVAQVLEVLSSSCIDLCLGQALESRLTANQGVAEEQYLQMIRHKTASLFRASAESGAILGGGTPEQVLAVRDYGEDLGMAFQMVDDLLSYTQDDVRLRKPAHSDLKNRRMTLPIIYALETGSEADRRVLQEVFGAEAAFDDVAVVYEEVVGILRRSGALERVAGEARTFQRRSLSRLFVLPPNAGRDSLEAVAEFVIAS